MPLEVNLQLNVGLGTGKPELLCANGKKQGVISNGW
jgi:hypothetical protein